MNDQQYKRYARQIALPRFGRQGQEKLLSASVLVIGAGGLGCPALLYLTGAGIGKIGIIDHDLVSLSNLHRQILFNVDDIGKSKAESAAKNVRPLNPDTDFGVYPFALSTENAWEIISQYDLVIDGTDHFSTRYMINDVCVLLKKPLVYGAVSGYEGQVSVFNYGENAVHYRHLFPKPPQEELIPNCEEAGVMGVLPGIIGTMQASEAIKILSGVGKTLAGELLTYNALNNEILSFCIPFLENVNSLVPQSREAFEQKDYVFECADPAKARFTIDTEVFDALKDNEDVIIIDVREEGELPEVSEFVHIKYPMSRLKQQMVIVGETTIIVFCQVGQRSLIAARAIAEHFGESRKVYSLSGGITNWKKNQM